MNREELMSQAFELQGKTGQLIMQYRIENWLSLDLTMTQLKSMVYILSRGKVNFRELARALDVSPSVVTGIVDRLESQGMINRVDNTQDRRVQWLVISDEGRALLEGIRQKATKEFLEILQGLNDEELSVLIQGYSALAKAAEVYLKSQNAPINAT